MMCKEWHVMTAVFCMSHSVKSVMKGGYLCIIVVGLQSLSVLYAKINFITRQRHHTFTVWTDRGIIHVTAYTLMINKPIKILIQTRTARWINCPLTKYIFSSQLTFPFIQANFNEYKDSKLQQEHFTSYSDTTIAAWKATESAMAKLSFYDTNTQHK